MTHLLHRILLGAWVLLSTYFEFVHDLTTAYKWLQKSRIESVQGFLLGAKREKQDEIWRKHNPPKMPRRLDPNAGFPKFEISWLPGTTYLFSGASRSFFRGCCFFGNCQACTVSACFIFSQKPGWYRFSPPPSKGALGFLADFRWDHDIHGVKIQLILQEQKSTDSHDHDQS